MAVSSIREDKNKSVNFPCLMISSYNNVWMMYDHKRGTVVSVGKSSNRIGQHAENLDINDMKPFTGSITLSNE